MVKFFLIISLAFSFLCADAQVNQELEQKLNEKIKNLVDAKIYAKDKAYIDTVISPKSNYYRVDGTIDTIKVIKTLKDNGILKLFFKSPREITISFKTKTNPNFFVKVISDSLVNIGYYKYVIEEANYDGVDFLYKIGLLSEYVTDPMVLNKELQKSGSEIVDVIRESDAQWVYVVDMKNAELDVPTLQDGIEHSLKRSLYAYWLNVSNIEELQIYSSNLNNWFPYVAYYDKQLNLLKVEKVDSKKTNLTIQIDQKSHYIKISDLYNMKNIKDELILKPMGKK